MKIMSYQQIFSSVHMFCFLFFFPDTKQNSAQNIIDFLYIAIQVKLSFENALLGW